MAMHSVPPSARADLKVGGTLGPYRLDSMLGEGAMGIVFKAVREDNGGDPVALKVMKTTLSGDEVYKQRFFREVRVAREVQNKHLVPILEAGEADGYYYLTVAYVEGGSLEDRIQAEGPLPIRDCVSLTAGIAAGLEALHGDGLVHRDVKPSNVMLNDEGKAALTDFGLAKGCAYTVLTKPGEVLGTLDYIAPELIQGQPANPASDIYALACVTYECLTGAAPFASRSFFEVAVAHLEDEPPDPTTVRPEVPNELAWVVLQSLAKDPARRPTTATAYSHMLRVASGAVNRGGLT